MADEAEAKRQRKLEKKSAKEAAAAAAVEEDAEEDEAEAKRQRKAAKKAAKEAAAAAAAAKEEEEEEGEEVDEAEAKRQRKAAKKAAKEAAAAQEEEPEEAPKRAKKAKRAAVSEEAEEAPEAKKSKQVAEQDDEVPTAATEGAALRVFIKGLPYSVEEASLRADFAECGEITKLQLPMGENGQPKGFAFISFATRQGFDAALKYDNTDYGGRYINVSEAMAEKGGGKGKAGKAGKAADWTCPACGDLVFARNNACRSCGAERPGGPAGKDAGGGKGGGRAGDWNCPKCGDLVFGRNDACRQCGAERPGGPVAQGHVHENTVFMRGLPWAVTEEELRKHFAACGEMESVRLPLNGEGRPAGIAFIKFVAPEGVAAALKFDESDYGGRAINVCKSGEVQSKGKGKGKDGGKGKGKDKGKDGKGKGKGKSKAPSDSFAKSTGCIVASKAAVKTFEDSDDEG